MGMYSWDIDGGFSSLDSPIQRPSNPRLTVRSYFDPRLSMEADPCES